MLENNQTYPSKSPRVQSDVFRCPFVNQNSQNILFTMIQHSKKQQILTPEKRKAGFVRRHDGLLV